MDSLHYSDPTLGNKKLATRELSDPYGNGENIQAVEIFVTTGTDGNYTATPLMQNLAGRLGVSTGKTVVMKTGALTSSAGTADQVILTYTVTSLKTFYLQAFQCEARLTSYATTATLFGSFSLETPSGTKVFTQDIANAGVITPQGVTFTEPVPIAAGVVVRLVCTPAASTSFAWSGNLAGYEV